MFFLNRDIPVCLKYYRIADFRLVVVIMSLLTLYGILVWVWKKWNDPETGPESVASPSHYALEEGGKAKHDFLMMHLFEQ